MIESVGCRGAWAEVGYALAKRKPVLMMCAEELPMSVFALLPEVKTYNANGLKGVIGGLNQLRGVLKRDRAIDGSLME